MQDPKITRHPIDQALLWKVNAMRQLMGPKAYADGDSHNGSYEYQHYLDSPDEKFEYKPPMNSHSKDTGVEVLFGLDNAVIQ